MSCSPRIYVIMQATTMLIKFCDLPWGWPKCSVMSQVVSHLTRGTRFESRLGCSQTYAFWGLQGSFSSGCEGQTGPPRLDSMPECSSCPEEVVLQVPRPRIEPRTLATTPGHFTTTLLGPTKVRLRSQPDVVQSQNLRHHASHNHATKFCDLHWGWPM